MTAKLDPITLELIHSKVTSVIEEMRIVLFHSGYSTVLRESEDGSAGLLDARLRTVAVSKKLPLHFGSFAAVADHLGEYYQMDDFADGDVVVFNHPYAGNVTHPNDTVVLMPVFAQEQLVAFTATLAHKADLGGPRAAHVAQDIWEEGLVIPPTKLYSRGKVNPEIERFIAANSRIPVETLGDLRGQVAACRVGAQRVEELCERFGIETVRDGCGELMARVAGQLRDALDAIPDGTREAEGFLDHDGIGYERQRRVHVLVTKQGREILFDFSASDEQARGPVNVTSALIKNTCYFGLMAMTDASLPFNHGFVDVVQTRFKEGTVVCPRHGAPVSYYVPLAYLTADVVLHALGKFIPERAVGSSGGGGGVRIASSGGKSGKPWVFMELLDTALGASGVQDGISLIHGTLGVGQFRPGPIEIHETEFPMRVTRFDVRADSGGPGKFRGGLGCIREYQLLDDAAVRVRGKGDMRSKCPPWGVLGGKAARTGFYALNGDELSETVREAVLAPGDTVQVNMNAGGGYGDPLERDPEAVLGDVLDGYVSLQGARDDYGVAIDPATASVDLAATGKLRHALRG
ncbi:MAG TPA: hydantoinase B/oxoprolinase family protein [Candidatus Deferrimicrobium sp.]|nr:hydantoinase B/oxoprolinase family protein [Candidatus Deferrimicrobium sp.]